MALSANVGASYSTKAKPCVLPSEPMGMYSESSLASGHCALRVSLSSRVTSLRRNADRAAYLASGTFGRPSMTTQAL